MASGVASIIEEEPISKKPRERCEQWCSWLVHCRHLYSVSTILSIRQGYQEDHKTKVEWKY